MLENPPYFDDRCELNCICGASSGLRFRRRDRYGLDFNFVLCRKCGHVRIKNPLSESAAIRFYSSSDYRSLYFLGETTEAVLRRKTPLPNSKSSLLSYVEGLGISSGTIVEWGCGGGWNLVPFRDAGWKTIGFDFDQTYISLGRELLHLDLFEIDNLSEVREIAKAPDVILMNHVIEHVSQPHDTLLQLRELCSDSTVLVVGVPLLETIGLWHWHDFFHIAHIHYFSHKTFTMTVQNAGFSVVDADVGRGMFALKKAEVENPTPTHRSGFRNSAFLLCKGFLEPRFRCRRLASRLLGALGLLDLARKLRRRNS